MTEEKICALIALAVAVTMLVLVLNKNYRMKKIYGMNKQQYQNYKKSQRTIKKKNKFKVVNK